MISKVVNGLLSPPGAKAKLSILIFHRVLEAPDPLIPDAPCAQAFERLLQWLRRSFNVLPLDEAVKRLAGNSLPARAACITFDDGYLDNYTIAMPLLKKHGLSATFFIATQFLDGGRMWNDTLIEALRNSNLKDLDLSALGLGRWPLENLQDTQAAIHGLLGGIKYRAPEERDVLVAEIARISGSVLPNDLMMSPDHVRQMRSAGMGIGAHTCSHPILARLDDAQAEAEIRGSKQMLEELLGEAVPLFAYPNGKPGRDYEGKHAAMVARAGFKAAVTTSIGASSGMHADLYQLPRFTPWDSTELRFGLRLANNTRQQGKTV
ncbi:MAG: polysaccharide deacetylase family protein [Chromatocurvus sp.]